MEGLYTAVPVRTAVLSKTRTSEFLLPIEGVSVDTMAADDRHGVFNALSTRTV
jgi:hypothetical protein